MLFSPSSLLASVILSAAKDLMPAATPCRVSSVDEILRYAQDDRGKA
jgi:hypothetical protein